MIEIIPYDAARFDEAYYARGERGGFHNYEYEHPEQQQQLALKYQVCAPVPHESALFVGCARGFEVAYWQAQGKQAWGVDVSDWALAHLHPSVKGRCTQFNGMHIPGGPSSFDLVAAFDVLTIPPVAISEKLCAEMVRVAKNGIVIRSVVKNWRNLKGGEFDVIDGVSVRYQTLEFWDRQFSQSGKFQLDTAKMHFQYETLFVWRRTE